MNLHVVIPCSVVPTAEHLSAIREACSPKDFMLSVPEGEDVSGIVSDDVFITRHVNAPDDIGGRERIVYYTNHIRVPLAQFTCPKVVGSDVVLYLHDNVPGQAVFTQVIDALLARRPIAVKFASVEARNMGVPPPGSPIIYDYADRCIAWRAGAFCKYEDMPALTTEEAGGFTSIQDTMLRMDANGDRYLWTELPCEET